MEATDSCGILAMFEGTDQVVSVYDPDSDSARSDFVVECADQLGVRIRDVLLSGASGEYRYFYPWPSIMEVDWVINGDEARLQIRLKRS